MKAAVYKKYGPPEVVSVREIDQPVPREDELLIRVRASTVNRTDCGFRSANYFAVRFFSGLFRPKYAVLGCEFAGVVEKVGHKVGKFKAGDRVFGFNDAGFGGHGQYMTIRDRDVIMHIPDNLDFETAAPLLEGSHYALCDILAGKVKAGQNVLVYGATGAIGTAAVQILKDMNVRVTAVGNTANVELMRSLGADEVIDYQTEDFTRTETRFDFVFDAVGKTSYGVCKPLMKPKSIFAATELGKGYENIYLALLTPLYTKKRVIFPIPDLKRENLEYLRSLAEKGKFRPVIDRTYPLDDIVEAYRYVETGQKTGNVIVTIP